MLKPRPERSGYVGRLAPTPSGELHVGHAHTFGLAAMRARAAGGTLLLRMEDLDADRCKPEYVDGIMTDLVWFGLTWQEGPDVGGPCAPYTQSERLSFYREVWAALRDSGLIYPSPHSRKDVAAALTAPHPTGQEPIFPPALRPPPGTGADAPAPGAVNWRFRVPDGEVITFTDGRLGPCRYVAGQEFGDFLVWRKDGFPSYELACAADDGAMGITEIVRGEDLLLSHARQLLLYRALGWTAPTGWHAPLIRDAAGRRLAKREAAHSLRALREAGTDPATLWPTPEAARATVRK